MSGWCCPTDGTPLVAGADALSCPACETVYPQLDGVVRLAETSRDSPAAIAGLHARMRDTSVDAAAVAFCEQRGCRRVRNGADWKLLVPVRREARILEIGPGFGDVTMDLAARAASVNALAADVHAAGIVRTFADEVGATNVAVGVAAGLERLPVGDATCDVVTCLESGLRGFGVGRGDLTRLATELRRVAAPGATVLVGQSNPLHRLPGIEALRGRVSKASGRTLDGVLHDALIHSPGRFSGAALLRAMAAAGFAPPRVYAPIPDEERARAILPVADRAVVNYFLANLVRRNAPLTRLALAVARPLVALGFFPRMVPYWFYVFDVEEKA